MANKYLDVFISNTGKKIKTSGMTLNQNSSNNQVRAMLEGNYDLVEVWFRQPNGKISPKYHMIYKGKFEPDYADDVLQNYNEFNEWIFDIPLGITSFTMPNPSARLEISFAFYQYNDSGNLIVASVANSQIVVNRSNNNNVLDQNYNGVDVQNLWRSVGNLTQRVDMFNDMEFSTVAKENALSLKNIHIGGDDWNPLMPTDLFLSSGSTDEAVPTSKAVYTAAKEISHKLLNKLHWEDVPHEELKDYLETKHQKNPTKIEPVDVDVVRTALDTTTPDYISKWTENIQENYSLVNEGVLPRIFNEDPEMIGKKVRKITIHSEPREGWVGLGNGIVGLYKIPAGSIAGFGTSAMNKLFVPENLIQNFIIEGNNGTDVVLALDKPFEITNNDKLGIYFAVGTNWTNSVRSIVLKSNDPDTIKTGTVNRWTSDNRKDVYIQMKVDVITKEIQDVEIDNFPKDIILNSNQISVKMKEEHIDKKTAFGTLDNHPNPTDTDLEFTFGPYRYTWLTEYSTISEGNIVAVEFKPNRREQQLAQYPETLVYKVPVGVDKPGFQVVDGQIIQYPYPIIGRTKEYGKVVKIQLTEPVNPKTHAIWVSDIMGSKKLSDAENNFLWKNGAGNIQPASGVMLPINFYYDYKYEVVDPDQHLKFKTPKIYRAKDNVFNFYYDFESVNEFTNLKFEVKAYNTHLHTTRYGTIEVNKIDLYQQLGINKVLKNGLTFSIENLYKGDEVSIRELDNSILSEGIKFPIEKSEYSLGILVNDEDLRDPADPYNDITDILLRINVKEKIASLGGGSGGGGASFREPLEINGTLDITKLGTGNYAIKNKGILKNAKDAEIMAYSGDLLSVNKNIETATLYGLNGEKQLGFNDVSFDGGGDTKKKWLGKTWICFGDSLTDKSNGTAPVRYYDYVSQDTGITSLDYGVSGSGYRTEYGSAGGNAFYQRIEDIKEDFDVITIFGSFNDMFNFKNDMGDVNSTGTDTIAGCMNETLTKLFNKWPDAKVGLVSPTPWKGYNLCTTEYNRPPQMIAYLQLLKDMAKKWSIPYLDLFECSNLKPWMEYYRKHYYTRDGDNGVHPDSAGHKVIYPQFKAFLEEILG